MRLTFPNLKPHALLCLFLMLVLLPITGTAASDSKGATPEGTDLHVTSDEMIAEQKSQVVEFIGNVRATREDTILLADSLKVFFHSSDTRKQNQSNVKKIVATGHVEYTAGDRKAYADKAVYTTDDQILVLTGENPKLLTGKSYVTGKKITLFRADDRVVVESAGKNRVQAFFDAQDNTEASDNDKPRPLAKED